MTARTGRGDLAVRIHASLEAGNNCIALLMPTVRHYSARNAFVGHMVPAGHRNRRAGAGGLAPPPMSNGERLSARLFGRLCRSLHLSSRQLRKLCPRRNSGHIRLSEGNSASATHRAADAELRPRQKRRELLTSRGTTGARADSDRKLWCDTNRYRPHMCRRLFCSVLKKSGGMSLRAFRALSEQYALNPKP